MKYRIVARPLLGELYYYAQQKIFGIWVDCRLRPFSDVYYSHSRKQEEVEKWVETQINEKRLPREQVVKEYQ
jgi:hypothetical protein